MREVYMDSNGKIFEGEMADLIMGLDDLKIEKEKQLKRSKIEKDKKSKDEKSKGANDMDRSINKSRKGKVIEIDKREGAIKRKAKVIGEVVSMSIKSTLNDSWTYAAGASVGLNQGLKYKGDFKAGTKAGLATVAVLAGVNVVGNIILNKEVIKEA